MLPALNLASVVGSLASVLHWENKRVIGVYSLFLDDSGHEDDPQELLLAWGGGWAAVETWAQAVHKWSGVLTDPRFDVPAFHMTDFLGCYGAFSKWRHVPETAEAFIRSLIAIQKRYVTPTVASTFAQAYNAHQRPGPEEEKEKRQAHDFGFEHCLGRANEGVPSDVRANVLLARTPKWVGRTQRIYHKFVKANGLQDRFAGYSAELPSDYIEFQIVDLIVSGFTRGQALQRPESGWLHDYFLYLFDEHHQTCIAKSSEALRGWRSVLADEEDE